jgi:hypothetical protein
MGIPNADDQGDSRSRRLPSPAAFPGDFGPFGSPGMPGMPMKDERPRPAGPPVSLETGQALQDVIQLVSVDQISNGLWVLIGMASRDGYRQAMKRIRPEPASIDHWAAERAARDRVALAYPDTGHLYAESKSEDAEGTWTVRMRRSDSRGHFVVEAEVSRAKDQVVARIIRQTWELSPPELRPKAPATTAREASAEMGAKESGSGWKAAWTRWRQRRLGP